MDWQSVNYNNYKENWKTFTLYTKIWVFIRELFLLLVLKCFPSMWQLRCFSKNRSLSHFKKCNISWNLRKRNWKNNQHETHRLKNATLSFTFWFIWVGINAFLKWNGKEKKFLEKILFLFFYEYLTFLFYNSKHERKSLKCGSC